MTQTIRDAELSVDECWDLLRQHEFGRLGYILDGRANIVPINYGIDGDSLVFRTAEGSKVHAMAMDREVAFEIDEIDDEYGMSVVVLGTATRLPEQFEARLEQDGLRPWLSTNKPILVRIGPSEIHGRRYPLFRPWKRMMR